MALLTSDELNSLEFLLPFANARELERIHFILKTATEPPNLIEWAATHLRHRLTTYDPKTKTQGFSLFHHEVGDTLDSMHGERGRRICRLTPRKNAKTTVCTLAYPLREALLGNERYIMIVSDTGPNVGPFISNIKKELERNKSILEAYPQSAGRGKVWNETLIELRNGVVIEGVSTGQNIRGRLHDTPPSLVIADDIQGRDDIISPTLRRRAWEWFNSDLLNIGNPDMNVVVLGTALHREAIVFRLLTTPGWDAKLYRALIEPPERLDLWDRWESVLNRQVANAGEEAWQYYLSNKIEMDRGAVVLWPEQFPLYQLQLKLVTGGASAFGSEQQNNPVDPSLNEWPEDYFDEVARPEFRFTDWPDDLHIRAMSLDPAKGAKSGLGDYVDITLFGASRNGTEYVEADMFRSDANATLDLIIRRIVHHVREFRPDVFGFEAVLFQSLYGRILKEALDKAGLEVVMVPSEDRTDKAVRIRRLTTPLAGRKMRFRRTKGTEILVDQLRNFGPTCDHDDGPDGLELARRTAWNFIRGKIQAQQESGGTQYS